MATDAFDNTAAGELQVSYQGAVQKSRNQLTGSSYRLKFCRHCFLDLTSERSRVVATRRGCARRPPQRQEPPCRSQVLEEHAVGLTPDLGKVDLRCRRRDEPEPVARALWRCRRHLNRRRGFEEVPR